MPTTGFMIRFPDGDYEYDMRRRDAPVVGETLHRLGVLWKVRKRTARDGLVTIDVEPVDGVRSERPPRST